jgi:hypothetical protein
MLKTGNASGSVYSEGTGTPEGVVVGNIGDIFSRTDGGAGTSLYVKEANSGTFNGWTALGAAPSPTGTVGAMAYFDRTTGVLTSISTLIVDKLPAGVDAFGRPNIWDYRSVSGTGSAWRQGAWQQDGDAVDVQGEGAIFYGNNISGVLNASGGAYSRIKKNRFGLYQIVSGSTIGDDPAGGGPYTGYVFQVNTDYLWLANNGVYNYLTPGVNITFLVNRTSGYVFAKSQHIAAAYTTVDPGAGNQQVDGDTIMSSTSHIYLGDPATTGTWRLVRSGNDLAFERYDGANWIQKGAITN